MRQVDTKVAIDRRKIGPLCKGRRSDSHRVLATGDRVAGSSAEAPWHLDLATGERFAPAPVGSSSGFSHAPVGSRTNGVREKAQFNQRNIGSLREPGEFEETLRVTGTLSTVSRGPCHCDVVTATAPHLTTGPRRRDLVAGTLRRLPRPGKRVSGTLSLDNSDRVFPVKATSSQGRVQIVSRGFCHGPSSRAPLELLPEGPLSEDCCPRGTSDKEAARRKTGFHRLQRASDGVRRAASCSRGAQRVGVASTDPAPRGRTRPT